MSKIAIGGAIIIPLGLAFFDISAAYGSVLVATAYFAALALDESFLQPNTTNALFRKAF
jgi:hypothetical protein